ncbi:MAG: hypothetical protein ACI3ZD_01915, partial [Prevotella sp.]
VIRNLSRNMSSESDNAEAWARTIADSIVSDLPVLSPDSFSREAKDINKNDVSKMIRRIKTEGYPIDVIFMSTQQHY